MLHQVLEEAKFAWLQRNLFLATVYLVRQSVELEIAHSQHRLLAPAAPSAGQHLHARQQLGKRIWLGQVVVAAGPQSLDPVIDLTKGREDQGGRLHALGPQRADDGQAVPFGQHAVDDQHVILTPEGHGEAIVTIRRGVGDVTHLTEGLDEIIRSVAVVLDDQEAHGDPIRLRFGHPTERALPVEIWISGHRSHQFQSIPWRVPGAFTRGGGRYPPPPLRPHPSGGDGCRGWSSYRKRPPSKRARLPQLPGRARQPVPLRADLPAGATDAGGCPQNSPAREREGNESQAVTLFHSNENASLTFRASLVDHVAHVSRRGHGFAADLEDHIASREPLVRGNAIGVDARHNDPLRPGAGDARCGSEREPELADVGFVLGISNACPRFLRIWQLTERQRDCLLRAFAKDGQLDRGLRSHCSNLLGKIASVLDLFAVKRGDDVTGFDTGFLGGAVGLRLGDKCAFSFLETKAVSDLLRYRLNLNTDPAAHY